MNCKKPWTLEHQNAILKPVFVNKELKAHLEKVIFDKERARFPETITEIENRKQLKQIYNDIQILEFELAPMLIKEKKLHDAVLDLSSAEAETANNKWLSYKQTVDDLFANLNKLNSWMRMPYEQRQIAMQNNTHETPDASLTRKRFIRACPIDGCKGFLSTQWKCALCEVFTCSKCSVPKTGSKEHVCNPDDVATAELLKTDTKPCPQCGTGIFKIDGCDQMWCIECRCAFDWTHGTIVTGTIHNPHYYEYRRRNGTLTREIEDIQCGQMAPERYHGVIYDLLQNASSRKSNEIRQDIGLAYLNLNDRFIQVKICGYCNLMNHIDALLQGTYNILEYPDNIENRIKYMTDLIDEKQFKKRIFGAVKINNKDREIAQVLKMLVHAMSDILNRFIDYMKSCNRNYAYENNHYQLTTKLGKKCNESSIEVLYEFVLELEQLINYANECYAKICSIYKVSLVETGIEHACASWSRTEYDGLPWIPFALRTVKNKGASPL
jgi:hypothetical protein